ncbi:MAG: M1 family metallopeptidase [Armatimonadetes bacterium]|nr:M1 family metallopeptidase [Armatimonadota bacterium]
MTLRRASTLALLALPFFAFAQPREGRTYDLQHVAYRLWFYEEQRSFAGQVTNTVAPLADGMTSVWFDAVNLNIKEVSVDGRPLDFEYDGNKITADLGRSYAKGEKIDVLIRYSGQPTAGLYFVHERDAWPAKSSMIYSKGEPEYNRQWLPTYDYPDDKATSECWLNCKPGYTAVSNGVLLGVNKGDEEWTYHWRIDQDHPTYLIAWAIADFVKGEERIGDLPVEWYVPNGLVSRGVASFAGTAEMIGFFNELTHFDYPYDRFSQLVVGDFVTGGMEHTTMVTNTIRTLHEPFEQPLASSTGLVCHELAHQWFGDTVTCEGWSQMWINEGFASLMPHFWTRHTRGLVAFQLQRKGTINGAYGASSRDRKPIVTKDYGDNPDFMFRSVSYGGGAARMYMLIDVIGEEVFWNGIGNFLKKYRFQAVNTDQFFDVLSDTAGTDLSWFRDQWFYREGVPAIELSFANGVLTFTQSGEPWALDMPVWRYTNGRWQKLLVRVDSAESTVFLGKDASFLVDPERRFVARFSGAPSFPADLAIAAYHAAPNAGIKDELISRVRASDDAEAKQALALGETDPDLRRRVIALVDIKNATALLELAGDEDRRIANSAISRLGSVEKSDEVLAFLHNVMENDPNPRIACNALQQIYKLTEDESLIERAWSTSAPNECYKLFALRQIARSDAGRARAIALDLIANSTNTILRLEAIRRLGSLKDADGSSSVYNALISIVRDEHSYQGRMAAAASLASYGNKAALEFLKPIANEGYPRFTNRIKSAIRRLERIE